MVLTQAIGQSWSKNMQNITTIVISDVYVSINVRLVTKIVLVSVSVFYLDFLCRASVPGKKGRSNKESRSGLDAQKPSTHLGTEPLRMKKNVFLCGN